MRFAFVAERFRSLPDSPRECYTCNMKLLKDLQKLPTWQKALIATLVIAVPAGVILGPIAFRWFTDKRK